LSETISINSQISDCSVDRDMRVWDDDGAPVPEFQAAWYLCDLFAGT